MKAHTTGRTCSPHVVRGLTCERYELLVEWAGAACQVCRSTRHLVIDHDHGLGEWAVRGLLCSTCNARLHCLEGPEVERYLSHPWHRLNPDHPLKPTRPSPTPTADALYAQLDSLKNAFSAAGKAERAPVRVSAEGIALSLLAEGEMPSRIVSRAPFSVAHLRNVARRLGIEPARPGPKIGHKVKTPPAQ